MALTLEQLKARVNNEALWKEINDSFIELRAKVIAEHDAVKTSAVSSWQSQVATFEAKVNSAFAENAALKADRDKAVARADLADQIAKPEREKLKARILAQQAELTSELAKLDAVAKSAPR